MFFSSDLAELNDTKESHFGCLAEASAVLQNFQKIVKNLDKILDDVDYLTSKIAHVLPKVKLLSNSQHCLMNQKSCLKANIVHSDQLQIVNIVHSDHNVEATRRRC